MSNVINLSSVPIGTDCVVSGVGGRETMKQRLMDLGLVDGTRVSPLFESLGGNPRAYNIRGAVIALRNEDADFIKVVPR